MDGVVGYGKNPGSYGFRLRSTSPRSAQTNLIYFAGTPINGVRIRHTELDWNNGTATSTSGVTRGFDAGTASHDGTLFQSCYSHHSSGFHFFVLTSSNMTIERCYFYQNGGGGGVDAHWESFWFTYGSNLTFRHNYVDETVGVQGQTGWLMLGDMTNVKIYGNVFMGSSSSTSVGNNGLIATWSNDAYQNDGIRIINNTFVDLNTGVFATPSINFFHNSAVDNNVICKNNLYFNSNFGWNRITSHSHEAVGGGQNGAGSSLQSGLTSGIFSNYNADDFTLAAPTQAGDSNVGAEYNTDMNNRQRGSDGVWDRGAFEFDSNSSPIPPASLPNAPSDLRPTS